MILKIHEQTPQKRVLNIVKEGLESGKVFIVPTDTVYALICHLSHPRAINELYRIKDMDDRRSLSLLCRDVAMASNYAQEIADPVFRFMKSQTPGPYTFIFKANRNMDRRGTGKRKEVGIRIVDHPFHRLLMEQLDMPLVSTSLTIADEYHTDPEQLEQIYGKKVEAIVDGGIRSHEYSTILDCVEGEFRLVRQGKGEITGIDVIDDTESV